MTTEERKKQINRIVNLLALADSTIHDEEADTARKMAGKLMAQYSIDHLDISPNDEPDYIKDDYTSINPRKHEIVLENAIGKFNGVLVITVTKKPSGTKYLRLVGTRENIEAHRYMMELVHSQRAHAWRMFKANKDFLEQSITQVERNHWNMGYAYGVNNKVWDIINAGKSQQQEWGLIVIDPVKAAEDWYTDGKELTKTKNRASKFSAAGLSSGQSVNLSRGVTTGDRPTILIEA